LGEFKITRTLDYQLYSKLIGLIEKKVDFSIARGVATPLAMEKSISFEYMLV
jgi:hypothetical protein